MGDGAIIKNAKSLIVIFFLILNLLDIEYSANSGQWISMWLRSDPVWEPQHTALIIAGDILLPHSSQFSLTTPILPFNSLFPSLEKTHCSFSHPNRSHRQKTKHLGPKKQQCFLGGSQFSEAEIPTRWTTPLRHRRVKESRPLSPPHWSSKPIGRFTGPVILSLWPSRSPIPQKGARFWWKDSVLRSGASRNWTLSGSPRRSLFLARNRGEVRWYNNNSQIGVGVLLVAVLFILLTPRWKFIVSTVSSLLLWW